VLSDNNSNVPWEREETVSHVVAFEAAQYEGQSQRAFAMACGVPRTTLQHWLSRKQSLDSSPALVKFFESPEGLAFVHRLVIAIQFVITFIVGAGIRPVMEVIRLSGLEPFVANSVYSRHKLSSQLEEQTLSFEGQQREQLSKKMPTKRITACEDETFHPEICLVAIEPVSNFILLEQYVEQRDAKTWNAAFGQAIEGLPIEVIQSTSDEGKGVVSHVKQGLGAHHSPDLFHVQQELSRATSVALAGQVKRAEKAQAEAATQRAAVERQVIEGKPKGGLNLEARITQAQDNEEKAAQTLDIARGRQERAHQAISGIGQVYHPVDLKTGAWRETAQLTEELEQHFAEIKTVAEQAELSERCRKGIDKAHRVVPAMEDTMTFFHREVEEQVDALELSTQQATAVKQHLVPAAYLDRAASKATPADTRPELRDLAAQLRADSEQSLVGLNAEQRPLVERVVQDCADLFQRSSSCVEGRNGQLALRHHSLHRISATRLAALTVVHNYFIKRPDGTTAAQRFFEAKPDDLFTWLLDHTDMPARPAKKRSVHAQLN